MPTTGAESKSHFPEDIKTPNKCQHGATETGVGEEWAQVILNSLCVPTGSFIYMLSTVHQGHQTDPVNSLGSWPSNLASHVIHWKVQEL